jgi:putative hydrolase of HD superfamily
MDSQRFQKQIEFMMEIDKLKQIFRQSLLTDGSRHENSAEHCWHLAVMTMFLYEYSQEKEIDCFHVVKMLLIHDLVEIDAGDTYCYDKTETKDQAEKEKKAADRIFNLLPEDQAKEFRTLWDEFEARISLASRFAHALDRFQPLLHNYQTQGRMWQVNGVKSSQVKARMEPIKDGAPRLWRFALDLIDDAVRKKMLDR